MEFTPHEKSDTIENERFKMKYKDMNIVLKINVVFLSTKIFNNKKKLNDISENKRMSGNKLLIE